MENYTASYRLVPLVFFLASLSSHTSAFYSTTLVVIRSINIIWPLKLIDPRGVRAAVVAYPILWSIVILYEIASLIWGYMELYRISYFLLVAPNAGSEILIRTLPGIIDSFQGLIFVICTGIPFFMPSLITLVCCGIQIYALNKSPRVGKKSTDRNTKITTTILQLTLIFVVCNTAHSFTLLIFEITLPR